MMLLLNFTRAVVISMIFFVLLGLGYPAVQVVIDHALFSHQADGSVTANGSTLVGQPWDGPQWFHGRPDSYDTAATGGSNLGPRSQKLVDTYRERIAAYQRTGITPTPDLIAASGSGLDPQISPQAAYAQVDAIAEARHLDASSVRELVSTHVRGPQFGFLGAAQVNVLERNEALSGLDSKQPKDEDSARR
jgi:K+-transporting ATPase ATPase C chain